MTVPGKRIAAIALLTVLLSVGQVGALLHGLLHTSHDSHVLAEQHQDTHGRHTGDEPCNAFDGLIGAAVCGAGLDLNIPPQAPAISAQFYFRHPPAPVVYSTRAPPAFHA